MCISVVSHYKKIDKLNTSMILKVLFFINYDDNVLNAIHI